MKTSNLQNCLLKGFQDHSKALLVLIFMIIVFITATLEIFAQQQIDRRYQIALKSRTFLPFARISQDTIQMIQSNLNRIKADPLLSRVGKIHFLVQLDRIPSRRDKEDIKRYGIQFLDYIPNNTWIIAASGDISNAISKLNRYGLRWVGRLTPDDKSSAEIRWQIIFT